jgi:ribosomal-protein-alanine N-acetyltransferase
MPMSGVSLMLARAPGRPGTIGFSLFRTVVDESELLLLAVLPDYRRRGVGTQLLEDFLERARNDGVARVHLEVRDGNPAVAMYRSSGFLPIGRRRNYYHAADGTRFDAITLSTQL